MKAIFMTEIGGRLIEIDRREVNPNPVYYCARHEPVQMRAITTDTVAETLAVKRERWLAHSMPNHPQGFAVFLFEGLE